MKTVIELKSHIYVKYWCTFLHVMDPTQQPARVIYKQTKTQTNVKSLYKKAIKGDYASNIRGERSNSKAEHDTTLTGCSVECWLNLHIRTYIIRESNGHIRNCQSWSFITVPGQKIKITFHRSVKFQAPHNAVDFLWYCECLWRALSYVFSMSDGQFHNCQSWSCLTAHGQF